MLRFTENFLDLIFLLALKYIFLVGMVTIGYGVAALAGEPFGITIMVLLAWLWVGYFARGMKKFSVVAQDGPDAWSQYARKENKFMLFGLLNFFRVFLEYAEDCHKPFGFCWR